MLARKGGGRKGERKKEERKVEGLREGGKIVLSSFPLPVLGTQSRELGSYSHLGPCFCLLPQDEFMNRERPLNHPTYALPSPDLS